MKEIKLSTVLVRAQRIAIEEERRIIVYRNKEDVWTLDRYFPKHLNCVSKSVILVNAYTGYETLMNSDDLKYIMPHRTL